MEKIRNFNIISHIDHGKSTLADRFLELTGTVSDKKMREQFLDMMDLEREKGITIKMQPVRMQFKEHILNLIDTPGHVDFGYEVSRSLAAVEGAILLVDATKGIQAQTLANLELSKKQKLPIIPVVNKIDSPEAKIEEVAEELAILLGIDKEDIFKISAKTGKNVDQLLEAVLVKIPPPAIKPEKPFRALIFDSKYDPYKGIIAYVRIIDGIIKSNEKIYLMMANAMGEVKEIGYFKPELSPQGELRAGEIGYIATGIKEPGKVRVGDTITNYSAFKSDSSLIEPLSGYKEPKPVVFASLYPEDPDDYDVLKDALLKLRLNDAALTFEPEKKDSLGRGFRCGFLGSLHTEIISERLRREFNLNLIISTPSVVFKITNQKNQEIIIYSPSDWPAPAEIGEIKEPWVRLEILTPQKYLGRVLDLLKELRGKFIETKYFGIEKNILIYEAPLKEIISGFYDNLKGVSQGFASMNYEILGYNLANLVKLEILIAGEKEEALAKIVSKENVFEEGKKIVRRLKEVLPSQLFAVSLQAAISGNIIARETISAKRKDVIAPLYGGDYSRKRKLLEKQKKGKKKLKARGNLRIPPKVFLEMFKG